MRVLDLAVACSLASADANAAMKHDATAKHNTAECRDAISAAEWPSRWWPSNTPRHSFQLDHGQDILRCCPTQTASHTKCVIYVRNQKVASHFLTHQGLGSIYPGLRCTTTRWMPYLQLGWSNLSNAIKPEDFVFTVVRDPLQAARAAFCELEIAWQQNKLHFLEPSYDNCKNDTTVASTRFLNFLRSIDTNEPLSSWFFHAYPQAIKVNVVRQFDSIIKLEAFETGMHSIASRMGLAFNAEALNASAQSRHSTTTGNSCCTNINVSANSLLLKHLRQAYAVDFTCFVYS